MSLVHVKLRAGRYLEPATLEYRGGRIYLKFGYNKTLIVEIKNFDGARWHPDVKQWSINDSMRNAFQLSFLCGENPYADYDQELIPIESRQPLKDHQKLMASHSITRRHSIYAAEMGTGKTLSAIAAVEWFDTNISKLGNGDVWYIGPVAGVRAVKRELVKWKHTVPWTMYTYEKLAAVIMSWEKGKPAPKVVIFDESSKIKNPTAKRSQASLHLANAVREERGRESMCILMSGTPAPKKPTDWWHQCETACPGFLVEGNINKLQRRLCIIEQRESITGGMYPHLVTWLDDENKCAVCGEFEFNHGGKDHSFQRSRNEVAYMHERMKGLVVTLFKKDCLDLPEKIYKIIGVMPTAEILQTAQAIKRTAPRAVTALNWLRELSDGFRYKEVLSDRQTECPVCHGVGECESPVETDDGSVRFERGICEKCDGTGLILGSERIAEEIGTPKDKVLTEILDEHDDVGRIILWAGFQASVDRLVKICHKEGWATLRVDGRGYKALDFDGKMLDADLLLAAMDLSSPLYKELNEKYPKIAFVGHPKAGGMALTLTAAPTEVFYSNSYDGEARIQAEDRAHRIGMDSNRGLTIIDLVMLPSDMMVIDNLKKKKNLQSMTMGELNDSWGQMAAKVEELV